MWSIDLIEAYAYGMRKYLIYKKEKIKRNHTVKPYKNVWIWLYYNRRHKRT